MNNWLFLVIIGLLVSLLIFRLSWWFTKKKNGVCHAPFDIVVARSLARKALLLFSLLKHFLKDNLVLQVVSFTFIFAFVSGLQRL